MSHPLYTVLTRYIAQTFIKEKIRDHYTEILRSKTAEECQAIKDAIEDVIFDFSEEPDCLLQLRWDDMRSIAKQLIDAYPEEARAFFPLIPLTLYCQDKPTDEKRPNALISYYTTLGFDHLLETLISEKSNPLMPG